jgi:hypothetical protein
MHFFFKDFIASCNENNSNVVEPEAKYYCIPEKPNLKSAKTVKPYVTSAWIWFGLADNNKCNELQSKKKRKEKRDAINTQTRTRACQRMYPRERRY